MIAGHAMVAWPATYGDSGVETFLCGQNGIVFQKNLGPNTAALGASMREYNPDASWNRRIAARPLVTRMGRPVQASEIARISIGEACAARAPGAASQRFGRFGRRGAGGLCLGSPVAARGGRGRCFVS